MLKVRLPIPRFVSAGEVFAGRGCIGALRALGASKALVLMTGALFRDAAVRKRVQAAIGADDVLLLEAARGEPTLEMLEPLLAAATEFRPDWFVAVGGGSVIDTAKLTWAFYEHPGVELDRITRPFGLPALRGRARFVAVPTTAGAGSEVSSAAVFCEQDTMRKRAVVSHDLLPDVVVLDPQLMASAPARVKAMAGMDALAHAVEGYVSRLDNPLADAQAEAAARGILNLLPGVVTASADEFELFQQMMVSAMMAGWVQNLKVPGVGHALAHQLGRFGIAHGNATALCLVPALRLNAQAEVVNRKLSRLANSLGMADADCLFARIERLRIEVGLGGGLTDLLDGQAAAAQAQRDDLVQAALEDPCARMNPRPVTAALVAELLEQVL